MKHLKRICYILIGLCLACLTVTPFVFEKGTITLTQAIQAVFVIVLVFLATLGTYLAVTDNIEIPR